MEKSKEIVKLAREAVEEYVLRGKLKEEPELLTPEMRGRAGVFISIKKAGKLRGCIGTFKPTKKNIAQEIISNAISAADHDPRFRPVQPDELDDLVYSVDIIGEREEVETIAELDPAQYGVIVEGGHQTGLLLPDLEGVDTAEEQVAIARRKAGIPEGREVKLYRFRVKRYQQD